LAVEGRRDGTVPELHLQLNLATSAFTQACLLDDGTDPRPLYHEALTHCSLAAVRAVESELGLLADAFVTLCQEYKNAGSAAEEVGDFIAGAKSDYRYAQSVLVDLDKEHLDVARGAWLPRLIEARDALLPHHGRIPKLSSVVSSHPPPPTDPVPQGPMSPANVSVPPAIRSARPRGPLSPMTWLRRCEEFSGLTAKTLRNMVAVATGALTLWGTLWGIAVAVGDEPDGTSATAAAPPETTASARDAGATPEETLPESGAVP
jgi:hypothetical protein